MTVQNYFKEFVSWKLLLNYNFIFEIETCRVRSILPSHVIPIESRPGLSLILLAAQHFSAGNLNSLPEFKEINFNVLVHPNLIKKPFTTPRFCLYVLSVASDCSSFLEYAHNSEKMPIYSSKNLEIEIDPSQFFVRATDDHGLIFELQSNHKVMPNFRKSEIYGCYLSMCNNALYSGHWLWEGLLFEHQTPGAHYKAMHHHPFFRNLDFSNGSIYMQGLTQAFEPASVAFGKIEQL